MNEPNLEVCSFCDAPLTATPETAETAPQPAVAEAEPVSVGVAAAPRALASSEPDWKREVAQRLEVYRSKRRHFDDESQSALPFASDPADGPMGRLRAGSEAAAPRPAGKPRKAERVEIAILQPQFDFSASANDRLQPHQAGDALVPVAPLTERSRAALLDVGFLLAAYAAFLTLFGSLGGQFSFGKADAAVYLITFVLFYAQYFTLFTALGGATPGMHLRGLEVVGFDGGAPTMRQLLLRSFGYLVSAGTLCLGFLWAVWDEDHLTWHDRMSQTYLTPVAWQAGTHESSARG